MNFILKHIEDILAAYQGSPPLATFLKHYFKKNPLLGSRDRRAITEAAYLYYRAAPFLPGRTNPLAVLATGIRKCGTTNVFLQKITAELLSKHSGESELWNRQGKSPDVPFSSGVDRQSWLSAHLQQPDLFLRILNHAGRHLKTLADNGIPCQTIQVDGRLPVACLSLPNGTKINEMLPPQDYVVQDRSSVAAIATAAAFRKDAGAAAKKLWDVCAGAGGKSLFWKEAFPQDTVFATDNRKAVLDNLQERFRLYQIRHTLVSLMDVSREENLKQVAPDFDYVLCDVPCSGSGTWGRTPERLHFFKPSQLRRLTKQQYAITSSALQKLKAGGLLIYITCSVFKPENEAVVQKLMEHYPLSLLHQELVDGSIHRADSMFVAVLSKG